MGRFLIGFVTGVIVAVPLSIATLIGIGHALAVEDPLARADAIVAISGDTGPRVATAVDLWKRGYADVLVFSGGSQDPSSASSAELMKRQAMRLGVPEDRIVVESVAATTEQNAELVAELMHAGGLRSAILVTSPYHQRRASMHFARAFGPLGLTFRNHPADDPRWDPNLWWTSEPARSLTVVEIAKLAVESMDGRFARPVGWIVLP